MGDAYEKALIEAAEYEDLSSWINNEKRLVAASGGASSAVPIIGLPAAFADFGLLLHRSARLSWGIGVIQGSIPIELDEQSDIESILAIWSSKSGYERGMVPYRPIGKDVVEHISGVDIDLDHLARVADSETDCPQTALSLRIAGSVAGLMADGMPADLAVLSINKGATTAATQAARKAIRKATTNAARRGAGKGSGKVVAARAGRRVATRTAAKVATRAGARAVGSLIPVLSAGVGATVNWQTISSVADAAQAFYADRITMNDLSSLD